MTLGRSYPPYTTPPRGLVVALTFWPGTTGVSP